MLGVQALPFSQSKPHSRLLQRCCGLTFPFGTKTRGMVPTQGGCSDNLEGLRDSGHRPFCQQVDDTLSPMVFSAGGRGFIGTGCSGPRVARSTRLCLSSNSSSLVCPDAGAGETSQTPFSGSLLASNALVQPPIDSDNWSASAAASSEGSAVTNGGSVVASFPGQAEIVHMAPWVERMLSQCSAGVRNTVMSARAPSTHRTYASKWKHFGSWCADRALSPTDCPISVVVDFLQYLLDAGRSPATLKVFVAALSDPVDQVSISANRLVVAFLKGAVNLKPPVRAVCSQWDLQVVLDRLCLAPYEPVERADIRSLSMKTAFLLAITSARRVSELHALSVSSQCLRWGPEDSQVTLWPNPAFQPKV